VCEHVVDVGMSAKSSEDPKARSAVKTCQPVSGLRARNESA
jgi:hypothetical protein